jgi:hypothetical protein
LVDAPGSPALVAAPAATTIATATAAVSASTAAATSAVTPATATFGFARFVHTQRAATELLAVERLDGLISVLVLHFHEAKTSRTACLSIVR